MENNDVIEEIRQTNKSSQMNQIRKSSLFTLTNAANFINKKNLANLNS